MSRKYFFTAAICLFFLLSSAGLYAQSSLTKKGLNGALFDVKTTFGADGGLKDCGGRLGYSIGGILDVGMTFDIGFDEIESRDSTETNIGIRYGILLLKQEDYSPVTLELGGSYGYSFIESGYYADQDLQKEGHGYNLTLQLLRDVGTTDSLNIRLGVLGSFRSYNYTIQDISSTAEELREFSPERKTGYLYGPLLTFFKKTRRGRTWFLSFEPLADGDFDVYTTVRTGFAFETR